MGFFQAISAAYSSKAFQSTMISDEPDEDADFHEDAAAGDTAADDRRSDSAPTAADWPAPSATKIGLNVDTETLAWFTATHADWQRAMRTVLRSWVTAARSPAQPSSSQPSSSQPSRL
ncbi:MAG TPA: hypothetical protein VHU42_12270 [Rhodopila sp.]|nr:hypothetical protein [Rhodopila sp.]